MTQPSFIYLLDEVDASIDLENREIFINILKKNIINSQFFMISFNSDMLNIEGRILKVTNGNINEITKQEGINLLNNK